jgi:hypothetical protein
MTLLPDIDGASATRFEMLLRASRDGDSVMVAAMLTSIPAVDLLAIEQRLEAFGVDLKSLIHDTAGARR